MDSTKGDIHMKKIINEFKAFISKGNVMDLAVGMIIGSAFTAIVQSLVKYILTPLINWIPGTDGTSALQTVLREAVVDAEGVVITPALILDWGEVISAVITFFCTAVVLFIIVKMVNKVKEAGEKAQQKLKELSEKTDQQEQPEVAEEEVAEPIVEVAPVEPTPTTEDLLKQIIAILEKNQKAE